VAAIEPILESLGLDLYDIELVGTAGKSRALRVLVDRGAAGPDAGPGGGLGLDAVTEATLAISPELDRLSDARGPAAAALRGQYTLEVSSPGLERPLRRPAHWRGAIGSTASVKTASRAASTSGEKGASGETLRRRGVVVAVDDDGVDLEIDGDREHVAYADIVQARTVFEWGAQAKPSGGTGKRSRSKPEKVTQ
jgi:ribosome maturation factor RimP